VATVYNGLSSVMSLLGASGMKLEDKGLYVAEVEVKLNAVRHLKVFEDLNLTITQHAAVVTDSWSAGGAAHEKAVVSPMVPASILDNITRYFRALGRLTPFGKLTAGCIQADVVPKEMLPSGQGQTGDACR
jgi:hypothetical protein